MVGWKLRRSDGTWPYLLFSSSCSSLFRLSSSLQLQQQDFGDSMNGWIGCCCSTPWVELSDEWMRETSKSCLSWTNRLLILSNWRDCDCCWCWWWMERDSLRPSLSLSSLPPVSKDLFLQVSCLKILWCSCCWFLSSYKTSPFSSNQKTVGPASVQSLESVRSPSLLFSNSLSLSTTMWMLFHPPPVPLGIRTSPPFPPLSCCPFWKRSFVRVTLWITVSCMSPLTSHFLWSPIQTFSCCGVLFLQ